MVKIIAIVGMPGSGKSLVASYLRNNGFPIFHFGEIIIREVEKRGLSITPHNEQMVREEMRRNQGMDVCAQMSLPLIKAKLLEHQVVIIDGLYSFSEYKTIKKEFNDELLVLGIFTPKAIRYERLALRQERPLTPREAELRDFREIEIIEKGGPIAIADLIIINDGSQFELHEKIENILTKISHKMPPVICKR
ncbi:AAA family ATPase [Nostoc sp. CHAB 5715]|uniref:AAA family ATPase n=1 Tax=Nostoc sp. CHAB 5715 TaxID=2780400 RepID=UPI001E6369FF|nr:AAA family ATPase [Nostoc sp. CHAB 5715]MCC5624852.1 AAA family ATPase [Nostoc sp. CHAB 5715]